MKVYGVCADGLGDRMTSATVKRETETEYVIAKSVGRYHLGGGGGSVLKRGVYLSEREAWQAHARFLSKCIDDHTQGAVRANTRLRQTLNTLASLP